MRHARKFLLGGLAAVVLVLSTVQFASGAFAATSVCTTGPTVQTSNPVAQKIPPCNGSPSLSGYPSSGNTGVQPGVALTYVSRPGAGGISTGNGWAYCSGYDAICIQGDNVTFSGYYVQVGLGLEVFGAHDTVSGNQIEATGNSWDVGIRGTATYATVQHNNLYGPCLVCSDRLTEGVNADLNANDSTLQVRANDFEMIDHPMQGEAGQWVGNLARNMASQPKNADGNYVDHIDGFFSGGGECNPDPSGCDKLLLRHNSIINDSTVDGSTAAIMLNNAYGTQSNRTVTDNLIAGGGFTFYMGNGTPNDTQINAVETGNRFSTFLNPKSGFYDACLSTPDTTKTGNTLGGNVYADGPHAGQLIAGCN